MAAICSTSFPRVVPGKLLKAHIVHAEDSAVQLDISGAYPRNGSLKLETENGTVKGFEYRCVCGHSDNFTCE